MRRVRRINPNDSAAPKTIHLPYPHRVVHAPPKIRSEQLRPMVAGTNADMDVSDITPSRVGKKNVDFIPEDLAIQTKERW